MILLNQNMIDQLSSADVAKLNYTNSSMRLHYKLFLHFNKHITFSPLLIDYKLSKM